jgi:hypothetical protein
LNSEERKYQTEVTPEVIWPTAKSLITVDSPKRPAAIYGISEFQFNPLNKSNAIADFLENQLLSQDLCDYSAGWVEAKAKCS